MFYIIYFPQIQLLTANYRRTSGQRISWSRSMQQDFVR